MKYSLEVRKEMALGLKRHVVYKCPDCAVYFLKHDRGWERSVIVERLFQKIESDLRFREQRRLSIENQRMEQLSLF